MPDCQWSRTGGTPRNHFPSPEDVSYTDQRRFYWMSPTGYLKQHPDGDRQRENVDVSLQMSTDALKSENRCKCSLHPLCDQ